MGAQGYIGRAPGDSSVIVARQTFTPTGITTNFTFASGYTVGYVDAYLNGARLIEGSDYTATDGSVVGLTTHAINGDVLELVAYKAFNATNVQAAKDDFSVGGDLSVTGNATVGSAITMYASAGIVSATQFFADGVLINPGAGGTWANYDTNTGVSTTKKVKIENNLEVTGAASTFSGNLNVGGVLTYEDVTNVDSIGIVTARSGIHVTDGKVGIGTNIITDNSVFVELVADSSQVPRLQFDNKPVVGSNNGEVGGILFRNNTDSVGYILCKRESAADDGYLQFGTQATGGGITERLRISSAGLVGIGTGEGSSSSSRLVVYEESGNAQTIEIKAKTTGGAGAQPGVRFTAPNNDNIGAIYGDVNSDSLKLATGGSERVSITGIGSVGIGQADPKRLLDVFKSSNTTYTPGDFVLHSAARLHNDSTTTDSFASLAFRTGSGDNAIGFKYSGSANQSDFILVNDGGANGVERLRVASDGDVGIGTDNPITAVHILSTNTGGDLTVERDGDGDAGPELVLRHTSISPADNDYIGQIIFSGRDDANNNTTVVRIDGVMTDVSNGSEDGELVFNTRNDGTFAERVRIDSAGRILRGVSSSYANASIDDLQIGDNTSSTQRGLTIGSTDECAIAFADAGDTRAGSITYNHGQDAMIIKTEGQNTRLTINRAGGVFTGVATATQFDATSDVALKENIEVIDEPITKLSELKGVTFDWKEGGHSVGVIAQDVEKVLPTAVGGSDNRKTVNYNAIIGLLVESVKDQQKQIEELKSLLDK